MRNNHNLNVDQIAKKDQEIITRYKEIESKLDTNDQEFLATDLLDPVVSDLLISVENDEYEKPELTTVYDYLGSMTPFEIIIGEILLRKRQGFPAPQIKE